MLYSRLMRRKNARSLARLVKTPYIKVNPKTGTSHVTQDVRSLSFHQALQIVSAPDFNANKYRLPV